MRGRLKALAAHLLQGPWTVEYSPVDPDSFETPTAFVRTGSGLFLSDGPEPVRLVELPVSALDFLIAARNLAAEDKQ